MLTFAIVAVMIIEVVPTPNAPMLSGAQAINLATEFKNL